MRQSQNKEKDSRIDWVIPYVSEQRKQDALQLLPAKENRAMDLKALRPVSEGERAWTSQEMKSLLS